MPRSTSPAAAAGLPKNETETCPVAALAQELKTVIDASNNLARLKLDGPEKNHKNNLIDILADRQRFVEIRASHEIARSGEGAILQVQLMEDALQEIFDWLPEDSDGYRRCDELHAAMRRMSYSLISFIESVTDARAEGTVDLSYMNQNYNPHTLLEEALGHCDKAEVSNA